LRIFRILGHKQQIKGRPAVNQQIAAMRRQLAAQSTRPDSRPHLSTVGVPALVLSGAVDEVCPVALQEELAAGIPDAEHVVLADVGHMAPMEEPGAVAEAIRAWLARPIGTVSVRR
jgi:pimeloyl-ACP methyl ester carboxylesterase